MDRMLRTAWGVAGMVVALLAMALSEGRYGPMSLVFAVAALAFGMALYSGKE